MDLIITNKNQYTPHQQAAYNRALTIGKLKALIKDLPDDMVVTKNFDDVGTRYANEGTISNDTCFIDDYHNGNVDEVYDQIPYFEIS